ncbi:MAG: hypothetical protein RI948_1317, partial [Bacteroidota bacterium]
MYGGFYFALLLIKTTAFVVKFFKEGKELA